jgi:molybdopterin biosynthesis enzyme
VPRWLIAKQKRVLTVFLGDVVLGRVMLAALYGPTPKTLKVRGYRALNGLRRQTGKTEFVPTRLVRAEGDELLEFFGGGSGRLLPLSKAEGLARIDAMRGIILSGELVTFVLF